MYNYRYYFDVTAGNGALDALCPKLAELGCTHPIIICDKGIMEIGLADKVTELLEKAGIDFDIYSGVTPEPTHSRVKEAADAIRNAGADSIIALGGGATIDTAKGADVLLNNDCILWEIPMMGQGLNPGVPIIAVPTTSGTGSDMSYGAMISDDETHVKHGVFSDKPIASICDPELTKDLPKGATVTGAIDAFAHAFEAYTCRAANEYTDLFAEKAMETVCAYLPKVLEDPHNMEAREKLMVTASYSGMLIAQVGVQAGHAIGHTLGGRLGVVHGQSVGVALPQLMYLYADTLPDRIRKVADIIGVSVKDDDDAEALGSAVRDRFVQLLKEWGVSNLSGLDLTKESVDGLLEEIMSDMFLQAGMRPLSADDVLGILDLAYSF